MSSTDLLSSNTAVPAEADNDAARQQALADINALRDSLKQRVIGQDALLEQLIEALCAGGHVLLDGLPGSGKRHIAQTLAEHLKADFKQLQGSPELNPSDLMGHAIYDHHNEQFRLRKGPLFCNLLLFSELNLAPARTQNALLEAMQSQQINLEGRTLALPSPFWLMATLSRDAYSQYPSSDALRDRFAFSLTLNYPSVNDEIQLLRQQLQRFEGSVERRFSSQNWLDWQRLTRQVGVDEALLDYSVRLIRATRNWPGLAQGASPRASKALVRMAQAKALLRGDLQITLQDLQQSAACVLAHRLTLNSEGIYDGLSVIGLIQQLLDQVPSTRP
jgi:MoxR-like ATPase